MKRIYTLFLPGCLLLLAGCRPYVDSVKHTFRQSAVVLEADLEDARAYLKKMPVYDYFNTVGMFYLLWDTPVVQATAAALGDLVDGSGLVSSVSQKARFILLVDGERADWEFVLLHNGSVYQPQQERKIDLDAAYKTIFGKKVLRVKKRAYELIFDVEDLTEPCTIKASNGTYSVTTKWSKDKND